LKSDYDVVRADDAGSARRHEKRLRTDFGEWLGYRAYDAAATIKVNDIETDECA
jgi:hypothetical protein